MENEIKREYSDVNSASNDSTNNNMEVIFLGQNSTNNLNNIENNIKNKFSSCKTLQRKLELKVERAKRNFSYNNGQSVITSDVKSSNSNLIPLSRLSIPGCHENVPLVEYKSEHSDDDEVSSPFFPSKSKNMRKIDLCDTFSIQEMTIESDSGDESGDSQNLELLPPSVRIQFLDKLINYFCCSSCDL